MADTQAKRHFGANGAAAGICARARWRGVSHSSGRYSVAPNSHAARPGPQRDRDGRLAIRDLAARAAGTAAPRRPRPCLVSGSWCRRESGRRVRSGTTSRSRFHTASASHGACVMKCWNA